MNNYHYIISSLPDISTEWRFGEENYGYYHDEIYSQCSKADRELIDTVEQGLNGDNLTSEFYSSMLAHKDSFIREYFRFDLNVRNAKVRYLNKALGREPGKDIIHIDGGEFDEASRLDSVLNGKDILERERGIDSLIWEKIDSLTVFNYFDIDAILGFLTKLHIIDRWYQLDEQTGRDMFKRLVDEVRGTFGGVHFDSADRN